MIDYQVAEKEAEKEAKREASRAASRLESGARVAEEHLIRRTRHAVPKRPRASASQGEPSPKKVRKGSEAEVSAQMPETIPPGTEEQEEEEEEEAVLALCPRGLRSRGPAILAEGEPPP